jgi:hypothetical protein
MLNEARTKSYPENYPSDAVAILDAMSFSGGKDVKILGSMSLRSQQYAGDYDAFEVVKRKGNEAKVLDDLASEFQSIIKNLRGMKNVFIGDIKAGSIEEWRVIPLDAGLVDGKIVGYNPIQSKAKVDALYKAKVITEGEKRSADELLKDKSSPEDFLIARKKIKFHIVRWSVPEVLQGSKVVRGRRFTLQEAFSSPVISKLDTIGLVQNNKYTDFSVIYEFHNGEKILNPSFEDIGRSLSEDIIFYKTENNPFKVLKREFALAKFRGDEKTIKGLTPVLNSDLGRLYSLLSDVGTLIQLLEDKQNVPLDRVRYEIDQFKARMASVYSLPDFLKTEHTLLGHIASALKTTSRDQLLNHLQQIEKLIQTSLTDNTKKLRGGGGGIPKQYLANLTKAQRAKQTALINKSKMDYAKGNKVEDRPKVSNTPTKRSSHAVRFETKYGFPITDKTKVKATFPDTDIETILSKGAGAYGSSGSRPNVSIAQWSYARLASVLTGGPSLRVDKDLVGPISLRKIKGLKGGISHFGM